MYDWNALWSELAGAGAGRPLEHSDVNTLADELSADLLKPARDVKDVAVYETLDRFILLGHQDGLQILEVSKHSLFDLTLRIVNEDEGHGITLPYLEAMVDNLATAESSVWRGALSIHPEGVLLVNGQALSPELLPDMVFPEVAYSQTPHFRDELAKRWREELSAELPLIEAVLNGNVDADHSGSDEALSEARWREIYERYAEIVRREQAYLSRLFSDDELHLIAAVLKGASFESAASCRGVWLAVEARLIEDELDRTWQVDAESLLERLKALSYAQEVALIEALSPVAA